MCDLLNIRFSMLQRDRERDRSLESFVGADSWYEACRVEETIPIRSLPKESSQRWTVPMPEEAWSVSVLSYPDSDHLAPFRNCFPIALILSSTDP